MDTMKIAVVGAAGRMGRALIQTVHATKGATVMGAVEQKGSPAIGQDGKAACKRCSPPRLHRVNRPCVL